MKNLLIVYHSKTGHTKDLAQAVYAGATHHEITDVQVRMLTAVKAGANDLLWADGLLLGTPENFGYMSGAIKDFFDRTFYEVEGKLSPLPYALFIAAGNDGSGAIRAISRIANGYPLVPVAEPIISKGQATSQTIAACKNLGMTLAAGIELGIY